MAWLGLAGTLIWNYVNHRRHRPTICSVTRRAVPFRTVLLGWAFLTAWILRHLHGGYPKGS